jgi:hypothetical protein
MPRAHYTERPLDPERIKLENESRSSSAKKARERIEHIQGVEHLLAYLETPGDESHSVSSHHKDWQPSDIREHAQWLRERVGKAPLQDSVALSLPKNIHPSDNEQTAGMPLSYFNLNIWAWEPELIDDLERVKAKNDPEALQNLRKIVRAGSWDTHKPANEQVTKKLALAWQKELEKQPSDAQLELTAIMNPDLEPVKQIVELFSSEIPECGPVAEEPARFIEQKLREAWKAFSVLYREAEKQAHPEKLAWPHSRNHVEIDPKFSELYHVQQRIIELRQMRDQAYFHLLSPNLCSFIKHPKQKHTPL